MRGLIKRKLVPVLALLGWMGCLFMFFHGQQMDAFASKVTSIKMPGSLLQRSKPETTGLEPAQLVPDKDKDKEKSKERRVVFLAQPSLMDSNPIPGLAGLNAMSDADLETFFHIYVMSLQITCNKVERMGKAHDGGWDFCLEERFMFDNKSCLVYSFGINGDFTFDDALAKMGCDVHSFDPSMYDVEDHVRGERVFFHRIGLWGKDEKWNATAKRAHPWQMYSLTSIRKKLAHDVKQRRLDVLKMDVESAEVFALPVAIRDGMLDDVRQLSFEIHTHGDRENFIQFLIILRDLHSIGFRLYFTSRNYRCEYISKFTRRRRIKCHELYFLNIKNQNMPLYRAEVV